MSWNRWIRQAHRWLSVAFTLAVLVNVLLNATGASEEVTLRAGMVTLVPLGLLLLTGIYLFVLPYLSPKDRSPRTDG